MTNKEDFHPISRLRGMGSVGEKTACWGSFVLKIQSNKTIVNDAKAKNKRTLTGCGKLTDTAFHIGRNYRAIRKTR